MKYALIAAALMLAGCATTTGTGWNDATVQELRRGMSKSEVLAMFGDSTSQSTTADGEVLIFKRASDEAGASGKYISVMTLGLRSGENAVTVDALRVELRNGVVTNYEYSENVDNNFGQAGQK